MKFLESLFNFELSSQFMQNLNPHLFKLFKIRGSRTDKELCYRSTDENGLDWIGRSTPNPKEFSVEKIK